GRHGRARADVAAPAAAGGSAAATAARDVAAAPAAAAGVHAAAGARGAAATVTARTRAAARVGPALGQRRPRGPQQSRYGNPELLTESLHSCAPPTQVDLAVRSPILQQNCHEVGA